MSNKNWAYCENKDEHFFSEPMKRMTVRVSNTINGKQIRKSIPVGWICPVCLSIKLRDPMPELKGDYSKFKKA